MANQITFQVGYQLNKTSLDEIKRSLNELRSFTTQDLMDLNSGMNLQEANRQLKQLRMSATELGNALTRSFNSSLGAVNLTQFQQELRSLDLQKIYQDFSSAGQVGQRAFKNITNDILTTNLQLKQSNVLLDKMATTMANTIRWNITAGIINSITGSIQQAYSFAKDLDHSLNDIRIVTGKSADDMAEFALQANNAAKSLAAYTTDYTNASLIYYQQGLSDEDVQARTETTLKAANVTQQSTAEVSEQLTAVWNGYKVTADEAELYVDKLAAVAASTAADLEELSTGMSRVASAANLMGVDVDQLNAQLATIVSVTRQAPESVGVALRSVYARMSDIQAGLDEETTLDNYTEQMAQMGINVLDANNKLRDMGDVIEEIGEKWDTMSREQQIFLSQSIAGTRQYNNMLALFDNWDMYSEAIETSRNAMGTLQEQQDIYMEGTAAHLKQLRAETEDLYASLFNADDINGVVDALTHLVAGMDAFVETIGGGKNVLLGLGAIGTQVFSRQIASGIATSILNMRGLQENAVKLQAQMEILEQFHGLNINDSDTRELIGMREQILSYGKVVTEQEHQIANSIINQTHELQNNKAEWEATKQAATDFVQNFVDPQFNFSNMFGPKQADDVKAELTSLSQEFDEVSKNARNFREIADEALRLSSQANSAKQYKKALEDVNVEIGESINKANDWITTYGQQTPILQDLIAALKEYESAREASSASADRMVVEDVHVRNAANRVVEIMRTTGVRIQEEAKKTRTVIEQEADGATKNLEQKIYATRQNFEDLTKGLDLRAAVTQFTQLASTMGQVGFAFNSLRNVLSTWKDEEATFGDKMTQSLIFFGTSFPMLISSFARLNEAFGTTNLLMGTYRALQATVTSVTTAHVLAQTAENQQFTLTQAQIAKIIEEYFAYDAVVTGGARAQSAANIENQIAIKLQGMLHMNLQQVNAQYKDQILSIVELIQAENIESDAKAKQIAMQEAFNKSLLGNPLIATIAAIGAVIGAMVLYTDHIKKVNEQLAKNAEATRDEAAQKYEEAESVQTLYEKYEQLYKAYKDTGSGKEELITATKELADALGEEIAQVDTLEESYNRVNEQIKRKRVEEAQKSLEASQTEIKSAEEALYYGGAQPAPSGSTFNLSFKAGLTTNDEKAILDVLNDALQPLLEQDIIGETNKIEIEDASVPTRSFDIYDIKTPEAFIKVYETINQAYSDMQDIDEETKNKSELYRESLNQWLKDNKQNYDAYLDAQEHLEQNMVNLAAAQTELLPDYDIATIDTLSEFEDYRDKFQEQLSDIMFEAPLDDLNTDQMDKLEKLTEDYFSSFDLSNLFEQEKNVADRIRDLLAQSGENITDIEQQISEWEQNNDLTLIATVDLSLEDNAGNKIQKSIADINNELDQARKNRISIVVETIAPQTSDIMAQIQSGDIDYTNLLDKDNEELKAYLDTLAMLKEDLQRLYSDEYPNISRAFNVVSSNWEVGTQDYIEALQEIQDAVNKLNFDRLAEEANKAVEKTEDELEKITTETGVISIRANPEQFINSVNDLLDAEYSIDIEVHSQAEREFDSLVAAMEDIEEKASLIGKNFVVAVDDIRELNNTFPGIIQGMKDLGDGTVQINKEIANSAIDAARTEVAADMHAAAEKLQAQATLLRAKQQSYLQMAEAARALAGVETNTEISSSEARAIISNELSNIKELNSKDTAQIEIDNQQATADNSDINAGIVADNWTKGFAAAAKASADFANAAADNMASVAAGGRAVNAGDFDVQYKGSAGKSGEAVAAERTDRALTSTYDTTRQEWAELADLYQNLADSVGAQANDIEGMITELGARGVDLEKKFTDISSGKGVGKKSGGGDKDPDFIDYLQDQAERYHDINLELEKLDEQLSRIQRDQDKLAGDDLLANLNDQLDVLEKQKAVYENKIRLEKDEANELRNVLSAQGATFDSEGYLTNYTNILQVKMDQVNNLIDLYNSLSADEQKTFKDVVERAKKDYETLKDNISRYDTIISKEIPELQDNIEEAFDRQIEINIQKFTAEIELRLDIAEAEKDFSEFRRKILREIADDDILGNATSDLEDYYAFLDTFNTGTGPIQALTTQVNKTIAEVQKLAEPGGVSDIYGKDAQQALEDLDNYYSELMSQLEDMKDLSDQIKESYLDMIDKAIDEFDKHVDQYDYINDLLNHDMNLIGLLYGDDAYADMDKYYRQIQENDNNELDFLRKRVDYAKQMTDLETDPEAREKWQEEWQDSLEQLNSKVEEAVENIIDKYSNIINMIFDKLNDKVTGGLGLDYVGEEWDLINANAERYLDNINAMQAVQELENKYLDALDSTDNLADQQKIRDVMGQQLDYLREKDKLTEYDVERANMIYELTLKQLALQNAQQSKTNLRLRRDSQGNYTYQYVSDEEEVAQKQQELQDAQNDLYNFDKNQYQQNLDDLYSIYEEFQDKLKELYLDPTLDPEERNKREALLAEQYGELINGIVTENAYIRNNLYDSAFADLALLYQTDVQNFKNMSQAEKDELMNSLIPQWDSGVQHMADTFAGEGGFIPTCSEAFSELVETTNNYQEDLSRLEDAADVTFSQLHTGITEGVQATRDLMSSNDALIKKYRDELIPAIQGVLGQLDDLETKYGAIKSAAEDAATAAYELAQAQREAAASADWDDGYSPSASSNIPANVLQNRTNTSGPGSNSSSSSGSESGFGGGGYSNSGSPSGANYLFTGASGKGYNLNDKKTFSLTPYYSGPYARYATFEGQVGGQVEIVGYNKSAAEDYPVHVRWGTTKKKFGWLPLTAFDTGGYTGNWAGSGGKAAILHEKELVLNQTDTQNILSAVGIVRHMDDLINNLNTATNAHMANLTSGIGFTRFTATPNTAGALDQNVHIEANFPGVRDAREIEEALNNLVNAASMHAFSNRR